MKLVLQCPKCHNTMLYEKQSKGLLSLKDKKRCVYCGHTFIAHKHVLRQA